MRTLTFLLLPLLFVVWRPMVKAQPSKVDSLTKVLSSMKEDTHRVNTLISLGNELLKLGSAAASKTTLQNALDLSGRLNYLRGKERTLTSLSVLGPPFIRTEERIQFQINRLKVCAELKDLACAAMSEGVLGLRYFSLGDYPRSLEHYYKAIRLNEQLKDTMALAGAHYNLSTLYGRIDSSNQAKVHISEFIRLHNLRRDSISLMQGTASLASIHAMKKEYDIALELHRKVMRFHESRSDTSQLVFVLGNIGNVQRELGQTNEALNTLQRANDMYAAKPDLHPMTMGQVLTQFGQLQLDMGSLEEAEKTLRKALELSTLVTSKRMIRDCHGIMADLAEKKGDHRAALHHHKLFIAYKDSLMNEETSLQLSNLRVIHDVEKKDDDISLLNSENQRMDAERLAMGGGWFYTDRRKGYRAQLQLTELKKNLIENDYLRSRLNTHFMKNALQSINGLINIGQHAKAQEYIKKFHRLMQWTLENASSDQVSLMEELEMLENYLMLEAPCAPDGLSWEVQVADDVDADDVMLPPLILQPFVENALLHGMKNTGRPGHLRIAVERKGKEVVCSVEDNGRGMASGAEAKPRSTGLRLVRERLAMFSPTAAMRMENTGSGTRAEVRLAA